MLLAALDPLRRAWTALSTRPALPSPPGSLLVALATFWSNYESAAAYDTAVAVGAGYVVYRWSLCVEEHFYLVWPAFQKLVRTRHARTVVAS